MSTEPQQNDDETDNADDERMEAIYADFAEHNDEVVRDLALLDELSLRLRECNGMMRSSIKHINISTSEEDGKNAYKRYKRLFNAHMEMIDEYRGLVQAIDTNVVGYTDDNPA